MRPYFLFLLLVLVFACAQEQEFECEPGYIMNGTICCLDKNSDGVCDMANVVNKTAVARPPAKPVEVQQPAAPVVIEQPLHRGERQVLVEAFARNMMGLWQQGRWREMYQYLPMEDKLTMSEQDFSTLMPINDFAARVANDPNYAFIRENLRFNQFSGLELSLIGVTLDGDQASAIIAGVFGERPAGELELDLVWENQWRLKNPFGTSDKEAFCDTSRYAGYCYGELGKAYKSKEYCALSERFFIDCYQRIGSDIPIDVTIAICSDQETRTLSDACLNDAAFATRSALLCDEIAIRLNWYECVGIIAGYAGNLQQCTGAIEASNKLTEKRYASYCAYGYARATGDSEVCKLIDNDLEPYLRKSCGEVSKPWYEAT